MYYKRIQTSFSFILIRLSNNCFTVKFGNVLSKDHDLKFHILIGLFILINTTAVKAKETGINIDIGYSESADIFEVMDNVSNWWPGFTEEEYQKYWIKNVEADSNDKSFFQKYSSIREKYYNDPDQREKDPLKNRNGFFSNSGTLDADPYAEAFYSSNTLLESFAKLEKFLSPSELQFIKEFYKHFDSRVQKIVKNDAADFAGSIKLVRGVFEQPGITDYFEKVSKFYNSNSALKYRVLYTWWPPIIRSNASPTGQYLIMRNNPKVHKNRNDSDIVTHEIIHTISTNQPLIQKKKLTETFLKSCPIQDKLKKLVILEEPLAVGFGQLLFSEKFNSNNFSYSENLYNNPWINSFSRIIFFPLKTRFEKGENITQGFVDDSAKLCVDLKKMIDAFSSKNTH